jgi:AcrR family transcriptional regulator
MRPVRLTRAQQQALTRERLLAAAERVLARHGYGGASIDLITAEAGYSKGAIYSNFESKEAVFLELLRVYMERDMAELGRIVSLPPHQLSAALSAWGSKQCTAIATVRSWLQSCNCTRAEIRLRKTILRSAGSADPRPGANPRTLFRSPVRPASHGPARPCQLHDRSGAWSQPATPAGETWRTQHRRPGDRRLADASHATLSAPLSQTAREMRRPFGH